MGHRGTDMQATISSRLGTASVAAAAALLTLSLAPPRAQAHESAPPDGSIAYVLTSLHWATYQKDAKTECPEGMNPGPREEFKLLFPEDGQKHTLLETQVRREIDGWYPTTAAEPFPFHAAGGPIALGMNLDGKVGPNDFTSPDGEPGIDNQLYRALGCIYSYRSGPKDRKS